jgi:hypothetical protein
MENIKFSQLSRPRQLLIRLCQRINHGCVLNVRVKNSDVFFDASSEASIDLRLDTDVSERPELGLTDFTLSLDHRRLLEQIESLKDGVLDKIVVHDGIPRRAVLRRAFPEGPQ